MNREDNCDCGYCQLRRRLEAARLLSSMQPEQESEEMADSRLYQENLMQAQTVDLLTQSLERAYNCNEDGVVAGIRRALDLILPATVESVRPSDFGAVGDAAEAHDCAPAAARSANAPLETEPSDFYGIPKEVSELDQALAKDLGCEVQVLRFPRD